MTVNAADNDFQTQQEYVYCTVLLSSGCKLKRKERVNHLV